ncbi:MAG TPA: SET domain-containing protein-lysine N-methyltransferase [Terriglobales bacterium]
MNRLHQLRTNDRLAEASPSRLALRQSKIHSLGCYATRDIRKGDFVAEYTGPRLTLKAAEALYNNHHKTYLFGLSSGQEVIDGVGIAAFINHSCDPNCETDEVRGRIVIYSIRNILAGEEITYDYCLYDGEPDDQALCFCRSKTCRGSMYSEEELKRRARKPRRSQNS